MKKTCLLVMPLMALSFLASCGNKQPKLNRWFEYEDWWNYCSNANPTSEATADDIGKEVKVLFNDRLHKVRLIDVDHKNAEGEEAEAHCTFEFMNVLTKSNTEAVTTHWNDKTGNNFNFTDSTLNDFLNVGEECILKKLPAGLQESIKEVNKKVAISTDSGASYSAISYSTKLFPLAHDEITTDTVGHFPKGEGLMYKYYVDHNTKEDRIKTIFGGEEGVDYYLRTPNTYTANQSWECAETGGIYESCIVSYNDYAIAPAFCI